MTSVTAVMNKGTGEALDKIALCNKEDEDADGNWEDNEDLVGFMDDC